MPSQELERESTRGQLIQSINRPLGFFVLALLIVESFLLGVLARGSLQPDQKPFVWAGLAMFVLVIVAVWLPVWFKPENLIFRSDDHLIRGKIMDQGEKVPVSSPARTDDVETLRAFWKPNGKDADEENEEQLKGWKKENHLGSVSLGTFLNVALLAEARAAAIRDLKIPPKR